MRSFSVRPARLILVPSTLQSHALLPFRPTSSSSAPPVTCPCAFPSHIIPVNPPVTCPFTFPSHIIPVSPPVTRPCAFSSHIILVSPQSHALLPFHFIQHFVPPLRFFSPCPRPMGKVPGFSAKMVHFPPGPTGVPASQTSLAPLGISTSRESAGFSGENGSLSPVARRGTGSTGLSRGTWHFHLPGKCLDFPRKRFTFPCGQQGYRLHRPLLRHLPFPPPGKVPGISAKTVHFPPVADRDTGSTCLSGGTCHFHPWGKCRVFLRKWFTFPRGRQGRWLHRPLWPHLQSLPPGKVPGISAKMVHFPPWPAGAPAPQASLAALAVSTPGESAGFFCENGSLSPVANKDTGSTGLSCGTCHFHLRGKCRVFPRKRFTFPRGLNGRADIGPTDLKTLSYLVTGKGAYE